MNTRQFGASQLVVVLIVAAILSLLGLAMQLLAFVGNQLTLTTAQGSKAFYAAEGAMLESISRFRTDPDWPLMTANQFAQVYDQDGVEISRLITLDPATNLYQIDITADARGVKRRLLGSFSRQTGASQDVAIVLVLDNSVSMQQTYGGAQAIEQAKQAALSFVDTLATSYPAGVRVSTLSFNTCASNATPLYNIKENGQLQALKGQLSGLGTAGGTNIADAMREANAALASASPDEQKVVLVLSDGVPNHNNDTSCNPGQSQPCISNACLNDSLRSVAENYGPLSQPTDQYGNLVGISCSQSALTNATTLKTIRDATVFSIFLDSYEGLGSYSAPACGVVSETSQLGRLTMLRLSSEPVTTFDDTAWDQFVYYKETSNPRELTDIYQTIAGSITSGTAFRYTEVEP